MELPTIGYTANSSSAGGTREVRALTSTNASCGGVWADVGPRMVRILERAPGQQTHGPASSRSGTAYTTRSAMPRRAASSAAWSNARTETSEPSTPTSTCWRVMGPLPFCTLRVCPGRVPEAGGAENRSAVGPGAPPDDPGRSASTDDARRPSARGTGAVRTGRNAERPFGARSFVLRRWEGAGSRLPVRVRLPARAGFAPRIQLDLCSRGTA